MMERHRQCSVSAILTVSLLIVTAHASCFVPNGTDRNQLYNASDGSDAYLPCHTTKDGEASMCCRLGDSSPDICRPDGLCQNGDLIWRESCTDSTWKMKGCVKLCIDGSMGDSDVTVKQCDDQSFCCDENGSGDQCCDRGQGSWLDGNGNVVNTKPASLASSTTVATPASTATESPSLSIIPSSSSSNTGAIIGGVVGGVGGALVIAVALFFLLRSHRSRKDPKNTQSIDMSHTLIPQPIVEAPSDQSTFHEMDARVDRGDAAMPDAK